MRTTTINEFNKAVNALVVEASLPHEANEHNELSVKPEDNVMPGYIYLRFGKGWGHGISLNLKVRTVKDPEVLAASPNKLAYRYELEINNSSTTRSIADAAEYLKTFNGVVALATRIEDLMKDTAIVISPEAYALQMEREAREEAERVAYLAREAAEKAAAKRETYRKAAIKRAATIKANKEREAAYQRLVADRAAAAEARATAMQAAAQ